MEITNAFETLDDHETTPEIFGTHEISRIAQGSASAELKGSRLPVNIQARAIKRICIVALRPAYIRSAVQARMSDLSSSSSSSREPLASSFQLNEKHCLSLSIKDKTRPDRSKPASLPAGRPALPLLSAFYFRTPHWDPT